MMDVICRFGIAELLVVANTRHGPGGHRGRRARADEPMHDHLLDPDDARRFLAEHEIEPPVDAPDPTTLDAFRLLRTHVRTLAGDSGSIAPAGVERLVTARATDAAAAAVDALFDRYPLRLTPTGGLVSLHGPVVWPGLVADLLPAVVELRRERGRLRMCGNPLCRFLFIDHSRNASRVWCETAVCGNRVRGHRHRLRRLAG